MTIEFVKESNTPLKEFVSIHKHIFRTTYIIILCILQLSIYLKKVVSELKNLSVHAQIFPIISSTLAIGISLGNPKYLSR